MNLIDVGLYVNNVKHYNFNTYTCHQTYLLVYYDTLQNNIE